MPASPQPRTVEHPADATLADGYAGDLLIGYAIEGRYRVERLLGEGGMGRVYEVTDLQFRRRHVLKTLLPELSESEALLERFVREARAAANVGGPHVVGVSDFGHLADGRAYYVMEHVDGVTLETTLDEHVGPMDPRRAMAIARGITRAVAAAHRAGVVHRDLKPDNVVLCVRAGRGDFVKLLDFGLARMATDDVRLTLRDELVGTPHYMAPEQCSDRPIDGRADLYAIGVLLYEMLTLELPFDGECYAEVLRNKVQGTATPPSERSPGVPVDVEALVMRLLARDPDDRFPTADDALRAFDAILGPESSGTLDADISGEEPTLYATGDVPALPPPPPAPVPAARPAIPIWVGVAAFGMALVVISVTAAAVGWILAHPSV